MFRFSVRLGEHRISSKIDCADPLDSETCSEARDIKVEDVIPHEKYNKSTRVNDIALIRLSEEVEVTKESRNFITTICLPVVNSQRVENIEEQYQNLTIAGWGSTEDIRKANSDVLMHAFVMYLNQDLCIARYNEMKKVHRLMKFNIHDTQMCAGGDDHVDT